MKKTITVKNTYKYRQKNLHTNPNPVVSMLNYSQCLTLSDGSKNRACPKNKVFKRFMFSHTRGALDLTQMPDLSIRCAMGCTDLHGVHHSFITTSVLKTAQHIHNAIDEYNKRVDATKAITLMPIPEPIITFAQGGPRYAEHPIHIIIMMAKSTKNPSFWEIHGPVKLQQPSLVAEDTEDESQNEEAANTTGKRKRSGDFMEMCREFMAEQEKLKDENRTLRATVKAQEAAAAESAKTIESLTEENAKLTRSLAALTSNQHKVNALKDSVASVMTAWLALVGNDNAA